MSASAPSAVAAPGATAIHAPSVRKSSLGRSAANVAKTAVANAETSMTVPMGIARIESGTPRSATRPKCHMPTGAVAIQTLILLEINERSMNAPACGSVAGTSALLPYQRA